MTELERRKQRKIFTDWKARARKAIQPIIRRVFAVDNYDNDDARKLGRVIEALHYPYYDILDARGEHLDEINIIAKRIFLQMEVEELMQKYRA